MAPLKKRVSKKNKKSWRKNVDIKDVDNFLEDQRLEERLGIKYAEQKNEDLFQIDKQGADENTVSVQGEINVTDGVVKEVSDNDKSVKKVKASLRLTETEYPKSFEALIRRTAVPDPVGKRNRVKTREEKRLPFLKKLFQYREENGILTAKQKQAIKDREREAARKAKLNKKTNFTYDVWSTENNERDLDGCAEWLTADTIRHTLHNTGKLRKQTPKTILSKTSLVPAIESPHPGISYNPSLKDHSDVLQKVAEAELKLMKEEEHLNRVTTNMFAKVPEHKVEQQWIAEMSAGLTSTKSDSDEEDEGEYKAINPPVRNKKKPLQKRRKLREALLLKEKLKQQKIEKRKISDIYRLRKFNESIKKKEEKIIKNMEKRKQMKEKKPFTTKLLSQTKYKEPEIDFILAEELSGNLRGIKPEGNILFDRFKSLQKRNILQPTEKRHVKKRKVKTYERDNTKTGWEPKGFEVLKDHTIVRK